MAWISAARYLAGKRRGPGEGKSPRGAVLVGVCAIVTAGCATSTPPPATPSEGSGIAASQESALLPHRLQTFLDETEGRGAITLAESPWGAQVAVNAKPAYFAASGRECRKLRIRGEDAAVHKTLACQAKQGWVQQRLVTKNRAKDEEP